MEVSVIYMTQFVFEDVKAGHRFCFQWKVHFCQSVFSDINHQCDFWQYKTTLWQVCCVLSINFSLFGEMTLYETVYKVSGI